MILTEPNEHLAKNYIKNSEETLKLAMLTNQIGSNMWLASQKYYAEYFAAYSLLTRFGIKTEVHSCTIEIIELFEKEGILNFEFSKFLWSDKQLRKDNQYYLKNLPVEFDINQIRSLIKSVRIVIDSVSIDEIARIRNLVS